MIKYYKIATINVLVDADEPFQNIFQGYEYYTCNMQNASEFTQNVDFRLTVQLVDNFTFEGELLKSKLSAKIYKQGEFDTVYHFDNDKCYLSFKHTANYSDCTLSILDNVVVADLDTTNLAYIYMGMLFSYRISYFGGLMMHGSAISYKGKGIIFTAPSGVGKSTQANLWKQKFGSDVEFINDDKPVLMENNGKIYVYGTPFAGKNHINNNNNVCLSAIINVSRDNVNSIEKLNVKESIALMMEALSRSTFSNDVNINSIKIINKILSITPVYRLKCTPTAEAVDVAKQGINLNFD